MGKAELSQAGQKMEGKDDDTPPPLIHAVWIMRDKVSSQFVNSDKPTNEWILKNVLDSLYIVPFCLSHIHRDSERQLHFDTKVEHEEMVLVA